MIYLRFDIRPVDPRSALKAGKGTAEFMFEQDDPRECTRQAVEVLRNEGWRALSLADAQEGFVANDFVGNSDFGSLYEMAAQNGISYTFTTSPELATAV
jgi:hypothetical protein